MKNERRNFIKWAGVALAGMTALKTFPVQAAQAIAPWWKKTPDMDAMSATQNLLLATHAIGLGAVRTGIYPLKERVKGFKKLFKLPRNVTPMALVVIGHPKKTPKPVDRYKAERVHMEKWG